MKHRLIRKILSVLVIYQFYNTKLRLWLGKRSIRLKLQLSQSSFPKKLMIRNLKATEINIL